MLLFILTGSSARSPFVQRKKSLRFRCYCCFSVKFLNCWSPYSDQIWTRI